MKQEQADGDDCNLDLKVEVNVSSECSLSSGECLHPLQTSHEALQSRTAGSRLPWQQQCIFWV